MKDMILYNISDMRYDDWSGVMKRAFQDYIKWRNRSWVGRWSEVFKEYPVVSGGNNEISKLVIDTYWSIRYYLYVWDVVVYIPMIDKRFTKQLVDLIVKTGYGRDPFERHKKHALLCVYYKNGEFVEY